MFEGRFSEILIILVLALIVLGPDKLPRVVSELGRWAGRARATARQFREQLEEEVQRQEARKRAPTSASSTPAAGGHPPVSTEPSTALASFAATPGNFTGPAAQAVAPGGVVVRAPVFSHAYAPEGTGAEPLVSRAGRAPSADERAI